MFGNLQPLTSPHPRPPATLKGGTGHAWGSDGGVTVDCTTPLGLDLMERVTPKPEVEARVDKVWSGINDGAR